MSNHRQASLASVLLLVVVVAAACAPAAPSQPSVSGQPQQAVRRITAAIQSDPPILTRHLTVANEPGLDVVADLYNPGLSAGDDRAQLRPVLIEQVPTIENGLWRVFPDGRMETTWKIRPNLVWHDGAPFTAADVLFTHTALQDPDIPFGPNVAYRSVEALESPDPLTFVVRWKQPYIEADIAFNVESLPRHLLERAYVEEKAGFTQHPYWSGPLIGVGPFRMREWVRGSNLLLEAFNEYALGRPKVDMVDVKFIPDQNTLVANVLAGTVDVTLGKTLTLEQALQIRDQWRLGRVEATPANAIQIFPQLLTPNPAIVGDPQFRRALAYAIDREEITDGLMFGFSSVVHSYLAPSEPPELQAAGGRVVRYPYDPRRAAELLDGLALSRSTDGMLQEAPGRRLSVEIRTITTDINQKAMLSAADYWQRVGVGTETFVIPRQLAQDPEYRATFPGLELVRNSADRDGLKRHPSSQTPLPENGWRGTNRTRYTNAEFDALLNRYFTTIPLAERAQVFGDIIHHMTDRVIVLGLFYDMDATAIGERLVNVGPRRLGSTQAWNAHEWAVQD
jgi:peptide/nickel transport system substrate-binding protein